MIPTFLIFHFYVRSVRCTIFYFEERICCPSYGRPTTQRKYRSRSGSRTGPSEGGDGREVSRRQKGQAQEKDRRHEGRDRSVVLLLLPVVIVVLIIDGCRELERVVHDGFVCLRAFVGIVDRVRCMIWARCETKRQCFSMFDAFSSRSMSNTLRDASINSCYSSST